MRVLVRADTYSWALSKRAAAYAKYPPPGWDVQSAYDGMGREDEDWDAVFLLDCHASPTPYGDIRYARLMASHCWLHDKDPSDWRSRGCNESRCRSQRKKVFGRAHAVAVYNREQLAIAGDMRQRLVLAPYCPDTEIYHPGQRQANHRPRVGWCYQVNGGLNSFKGLSDVLVPVIAAVGSAVEWDVKTPEAASCMTTSDLVAWLQTLDIFLCTSSGEGGPQGPFEAAACGCAVVSTDVGQVSDWDTLRQMNLIVPTYRNTAEAAETVRQMAGLILTLAGDRTLLQACQESLTADIRENWSAERNCPRQILDLFDPEALKRMDEEQETVQ